MTTSIYFSTERIQVVQGKFNKGKLLIQGVFTESLPEGTMINGVIANESAIYRALERLVDVANLQKQPVDLIVDSGSILTKRLCVPILSQKKLLELVKGEFVDVKENYENLIYDYSVISRKNPQGAGGVILCAAMESNFSFSYIEVFKKMNLKLKSIDIAISAEIGLAHFIPEFRERTFILAVLESNNIVSSLFVNGQYYFTNRTRLLAPRGTEESTAEISQAISSLMQFNQSQKTGAEISDIYFCGLNTDESELTVELSNIYNIAIAPLAAYSVIEVDPTVKYRMADNLYVTGNLLIKDGSYHG
ncbi:MAG: pilus assembly protein PilM [Clostridiales bacterium]